MIYSRLCSPPTGRAFEEWTALPHDLSSDELRRGTTNEGEQAQLEASLTLKNHHPTTTALPAHMLHVTALSDDLAKEKDRKQTCTPRRVSHYAYGSRGGSARASPSPARPQRPPRPPPPNAVRCRVDLRGLARGICAYPHGLREHASLQCPATGRAFKGGRPATKRKPPMPFDQCLQRPSRTTTQLDHRPQRLTPTPTNAHSIASMTRAQYADAAPYLCDTPHGIPKLPPFAHPAAHSASRVKTSRHPQMFRARPGPSGPRTHRTD
ncbi:hypothetical protein B0H16DRAFT_1741330 [Mycena metata]|uniref:Uncharacterized protein n=1 Tax=Mycena metata TaxID=1033252 RepID=A0AAD7HAL2_9AGAR|nr:hypothetical protein B0H16DRAFT_1741330 [Mycena metata]